MSSLLWYKQHTLVYKCLMLQLVMHFLTLFWNFQNWTRLTFFRVKLLFKCDLEMTIPTCTPWNLGTYSFLLLFFIVLVAYLEPNLFVSFFLLITPSNSFLLFLPIYFPLEPKNLRSYNLGVLKSWGWWWWCCSWIISISPGPFWV